MVRTPEQSTAVELSQAQARRLLLAAQGMVGKRPAPVQKPDVLDAIQRMGALQIDTISVVNRSQYFVLWSRIGAYEPAWLDELLAERNLFETWAHAACFVPIEDFPVYRRQTLERRDSWTAKVLRELGPLAEAVLARIRADGALSTSDFESARRTAGGWWNWRDEKQVLEALFDRGELMIAGRRNFQRIYDLQERVMPGWDDADAPPAQEVARELTLRAVKALGVATGPWIRDYFRLGAGTTMAALRALTQEEKLLPVRIEGVDQPAYILPESLDLDPGPYEGAQSRTALLSPFDPIVWDRRRGRELFGFDYLIECYTPAPKRVYGYFTLPILWQERLVGRLDAKAHRKEGIFEVRNVVLEPGVEVGDELVSDLATTLRDCAAWHRTPVVTVSRSDPPALVAELNRLLAD
jgi:uncharacterized protein YcaQ